VLLRGAKLVNYSDYAKKTRCYPATSYCREVIGNYFKETDHCHATSYCREVTDPYLPGNIPGAALRHYFASGDESVNIYICYPLYNVNSNRYHYEPGQPS